MSKRPKEVIPIMPKDFSLPTSQVRVLPSERRDVGMQRFRNRNKGISFQEGSEIRSRLTLRQLTANLHSQTLLGRDTGLPTYRMLAISRMKAGLLTLYVDDSACLPTFYIDNRACLATFLEAGSLPVDESLRNYPQRLFT